MDYFEVKPCNVTGNMDSQLKNLFAAGSNPYDLLKQALEREFRPNGAPEVKRMDIDRVKFNPATGKGSFRVVLDIDYTFGCEDVLKTIKNETSEWTFWIDSRENTLSFHSSPTTADRTTADEF